MASPERRIQAVPSPLPTEPVDVHARLASLEAEAASLRAEVAALHADLRWLAGQDDEAAGEPGLLSRGWLAAGWVRASLLLTSFGLVTVVSVPYLSHLLDPSGPADPIPAVASAESAPVASPQPAPVVTPPVAPVAAPVAPREEYIAATSHAGAAPAATPARLHRPAPRARAALAHERARFLAPAPGETAGAPIGGESP
jgi:hypothetical protein